MTFEYNCVFLVLLIEENRTLFFLILTMLLASVYKSLENDYGNITPA